MKNDDDKLKSMAGISNDVFKMLVEYLGDYSIANSHLTLEDYLLVLLIKLKLGITFSAVGTMFGIHHMFGSGVFIQKLKRFLDAEFLVTPDFSTRGVTRLDLA